MIFFGKCKNLKKSNFENVQVTFSSKFRYFNQIPEKFGPKNPLGTSSSAHRVKSGLFLLIQSTLKGRLNEKKFFQKNSGFQQRNKNLTQKYRA